MVVQVTEVSGERADAALNDFARFAESVLTTENGAIPSSSSRGNGRCWSSTSRASVRAEGQFALRRTGRSPPNRGHSEAETSRQPGVFPGFSATWVLHHAPILCFRIEIRCPSQGRPSPSRGDLSANSKPRAKRRMLRITERAQRRHGTPKTRRAATPVGWVPMEAGSPDDASEIAIPASVELDQGEDPLGSWTCGVPNSRTSGVVKYEGHLVLTTRRVIYEPMRTPRALGRATSAMLGGARYAISLQQLRGVDAVEGRLPRLRLDIEDEESLVLIISSGRFSVPWDKKKWRALEQAVERIRAAMSSI